MNLQSQTPYLTGYCQNVQNLSLKAKVYEEKFSFVSPLLYGGQLRANWGVNAARIYSYWVSAGIYLVNTPFSWVNELLALDIILGFWWFRSIPYANLSMAKYPSLTFFAKDKDYLCRMLRKFEVFGKKTTH